MRSWVGLAGWKLMRSICLKDIWSWLSLSLSLSLSTNMHTRANTHTHILYILYTLYWKPVCLCVWKFVCLCYDAIHPSNLLEIPGFLFEHSTSAARDGAMPLPGRCGTCWSLRLRITMNHPKGHLTSIWRKVSCTQSGWWFGTCLIFPIYWECHHPNWQTPSFFRGVGQPPTRLLLTIINQ